MSRRKLPSARLLKRLLRYEPETGLLFWRARPVWMFQSLRIARSWNTRYAESPALKVRRSQGCLAGEIFNQPLKAHRVIWCMQTGSWPVHEIDHINGDPADNRWANLRDVTHLENMKNQRARANNTSGVQGVSWSARDGRWHAYIGRRMRRVSLGHFHHLEDAVAARKQAERELNYHPNHGRARS